MITQFSLLFIEMEEIGTRLDRNTHKHTIRRSTSASATQQKHIVPWQSPSSNMRKPLSPRVAKTSKGEIKLIRKKAGQHRKKKTFGTNLTPFLPQPRDVNQTRTWRTISTHGNRLARVCWDRLALYRAGGKSLFIPSQLQHTEPTTQS